MSSAKFLPICSGCTVLGILTQPEAVSTDCWWQDTNASQLGLITADEDMATDNFSPLWLIQEKKAMNYIGGPKWIYNKHHIPQSHMDLRS